MNKHLERVLWLFAALLAALALIGCGSVGYKSTPTGVTPSPIPRADAPFDTLPLEHVKSLEESRKAGR